MARILKFVIRIQRKILHDIVTSVFLIETKFQSDTTSCCFVVNKLKYAILPWTNNKQGPSHYFQLHVRAPPTTVPGWVDERMTQISAKPLLYLTEGLKTELWCLLHQ